MYVNIMMKKFTSPKEGVQVLKVFLVESDEALRGVLREMIARMKPDFELVGEAFDGETALLMLGDLCPDILISDSRLPFSDGLALWKDARRRYPWLQMLLIVSSDDPSYARTAKALGVEEYLFRPVTALALETALLEAARRLRLTWNGLRERIAAIRCEITPQRREAGRQFGRWLRGGAEAPRETRLRRRYCRLLRVSGDRMAADVALLAEGDFRERLTVIELEAEVIILIPGDDPVEMERFAYGLARALCSAVRHYGGAPVRVGVGACADSLPALRESYRALDNLPLDDGRPILGEGDVMRRVNSVPAVLCPEGEMLLSASADMLQEDCCGKDAVAALEHEIGSVMAGEGEIPEARALSVVQWRDRMAPWLSGLPLSRARCFTAMNMAKPGLLMLDVAAQVGMTSQRFGVVFEQEMGMSFTEYLTRLRMNRAAALLRGSRMRVSAAALRVGMPDVGRFVAEFERIIGVEAREYRRKKQNKE